MSEEKKNDMDDELKNIKEKLVKKGYVLTWDSDDGSAFKVAKKEWDPTFWEKKEIEDKWPHNSFWVRKEKKRRKVYM